MREIQETALFLMAGAPKTPEVELEKNKLKNIVEGLDKVICIEDIANRDRLENPIRVAMTNRSHDSSLLNSNDLNTLRAAASGLDQAVKVGHEVVAENVATKKAEARAAAEPESNAENKNESIMRPPRP
jgi:hypothetical protein